MILINIITLVFVLGEYTFSVYTIHPHPPAHRRARAFTGEGFQAVRAGFVAV